MSFMATQLSHFLNLSILLLLFAASSATSVTQLDQNQLGLKKEKSSHFRLYWHDIVSGKSSTGISVTTFKNSSTLFGLIRIIDDPLTLGPGRKSKIIGRAQGFYAAASHNTFGLLMAMNFVFEEGKYNGSTISVLGHNEAYDKVREMPVIGGSGLFRFARGYVQAKTHSSDLSTGDAVVQYNCYVMHY